METAQTGGPDRFANWVVPAAWLSEDLGEGLVDGVLGDESNDLVGDLAIFEDDEGGDATDAIAHGGRGVAVDVHLHDLELSVVLGGNLIDDGRERATRPTPGGPEINHH